MSGFRRRNQKASGLKWNSDSIFDVAIERDLKNFLMHANHKMYCNVQCFDFDAEREREMRKHARLFVLPQDEHKRSAH